MDILSLVLILSLKYNKTLLMYSTIHITNGPHMLRDFIIMSDNKKTQQKKITSVMEKILVFIKNLIVFPY